jgi:hypothetical protein
MNPSLATWMASERQRDLAAQAGRGSIRESRRSIVRATGFLLMRIGRRLAGPGDLGDHWAVADQRARGHRRSLGDIPGRP